MNLIGSDDDGGTFGGVLSVGGADMLLDVIQAAPEDVEGGGVAGRSVDIGLEEPRVAMAYAVVVVNLGDGEVRVGGWWEWRRGRGPAGAVESEGGRGGLYGRVGKFFRHRPPGCIRGELLRDGRKQQA